MSTGTLDRTPLLALRWRAALSALWAVFRPAWLALPLGIAITFGALITASHWTPAKADMERGAIEVLAVATAFASLRLARTQRPFFLWSSLLLLVLLCREIHFAGTTEGVYLGLLALFAFALHRLPTLAEYLLRPFTLNALALGFFSYAIAVTLDARWWKPRGAFPGIPGEEVFHVPLEESMELVGHLLIALAVLFARRGLHPGLRSDPEKLRPAHDDS